MQRLDVAGECCSFQAITTKGRGLATELRKLDVQKLSESSGMQIVEGSLNLLTDMPIFLDANTADYQIGEQFFWHGSLNNIDVFIARWKNCPAHVFEIYSSIQLRKKLNLRDDDKTLLKTKSISTDLKKTNSPLNRFIWWSAWRHRENEYYLDIPLTSERTAIRILRYTIHFREYLRRYTLDNLNIDPAKTS